MLVVVVEAADAFYEERVEGANAVVKYGGFVCDAYSCDGTQRAVLSSTSDRAQTKGHSRRRLLSLSMSISYRQEHRHSNMYRSDAKSCREEFR